MIGTREADENSSSIAKLGRSKQEPGTAAVHATKNKGHNTWSTRIQTCSRSEPTATSITVVSHQDLRKTYIHVRSPNVASYKITRILLVRNQYPSIIQELCRLLCSKNTCSQESRNIVDLPLPSVVSLLSAIKIFEKVHSYPITNVTSYRITRILLILNQYPTIIYETRRTTTIQEFCRIVYAISKNTCRQDTCSQESRYEVHLHSVTSITVVSCQNLRKKYIHISSANLPSYRILVFTYLQPTSILPLSRKHVVLTLSRKVQICSQSVNYHYLGNTYITQATSNLPLSRKCVYYTSNQ